MKQQNKKAKRLERLKTRLESYYKKEIEMLEGKKSYGIGSRSASAYDMSLADVRETIEKLEEEIETLETGMKPRKAVGVVPRDW